VKNIKIISKIFNINLLGKIFGIVFTVLITRSLGASIELDKYYFILTVFFLSSSVIISVFKNVYTPHLTLNKFNNNGLIQNTYIFIVIAYIILTIFYCFIHNKILFKNSDDLFFIISISPIFLINCFYGLNSSYFNSIKLYGKPEIIFNSRLIFQLLIYLTLIYNSSGITELLLSTLIANIITLILILTQFSKYFKIQLKFNSSNFNFELFKSSLAYGFFTTFVIAQGLLINYVLLFQNAGVLTIFNTVNKITGIPFSLLTTATIGIFIVELTEINKSKSFINKIIDPNIKLSNYYVGLTLISIYVFFDEILILFFGFNTLSETQIYFAYFLLVILISIEYLKYLHSLFVRYFVVNNQMKMLYYLSVIGFLTLVLFYIILDKFNVQHPILFSLFCSNLLIVIFEITYLYIKNIYSLKSFVMLYIKPLIFFSPIFIINLIFLDEFEFVFYLNIFIKLVILILSFFIVQLIFKDLFIKKILYKLFTSR
jgi:hypothetical protein